MARPRYPLSSILYPPSSMSLSFGFHPLAFVLGAVLAAALTYWTYRRTRPPISTGRRAVLIGLRFVALFLILLLLAEPVIRAVQRDEHPPVVAVLVDLSQSLGLQDESTGVDVAADARALLQELPDDALEADLQVYTFGRDVAATRLDSLRAADSLAFSEARTDISRALAHVRDELKDDNLRGIVLISDGRYNTGRNPVYLAERYPVPIHTIVVGDTTRRRDVQVRRVTTNEIAYVDAEQPVRIGLRAEGFDNERATVSLFREGERLSSTTVVLPPGTVEVPVDLAYTPTTPGLQRLTVTVSRLEGEITFANNAESFTVRVLESKQGVLVLAAAADPDLSSVRQLLGADPNIEVTARTQRAPGRFYEGPLPDDLSAFDALVLVGYPGAQTDRASAERVARAAEEGVPTLFLLARQTDVRLVADLFGDVLPVRPVNVRPRFSEAAIEPTAEGSIHPIMEIRNVPDGGWTRLPPLLYNESLWEPAPDARVLATIRVRGIGLDDPLLAVQRRGGRRSAALLGAGTWRWRNVPEDLEPVRTYWPDLFSNLLQWITTREDNRPVRVAPTRSLFGGGEPVGFSGQVYDESLNPVDDATLELTITAPDGRAFDYTMERIGNGRYELDAGAMPEGTYQYRAVGKRGDLTLGEDNGVFAVGPLTIEFRETTADAALMRQIATRSNGSFLSAEAVGELPARLAASDAFVPVFVDREREVELWHYSAFLIAVLVLLTAEWVLRKRSGMV